jgi:single-strand DNA-binding protein
LVTVVGYVISPIAKRYTSTGEPGASFRVASTERRFDKQAQEWVDGDQLFVSVSCWRKLALGVITSLEKGDPVIVRGRLHTRTYAVEGTPRTSTDIVAYQVGPDLARCHVGVQRPRKTPTTSALESADQVGASVPEQRDASPTPEGAEEPNVVLPNTGTEPIDEDASRPDLSVVAP